MPSKSISQNRPKLKCWSENIKIVLESLVYKVTHYINCVEEKIEI